MTVSAGMGRPTRGDVATRVDVTPGRRYRTIVLGAVTGGTTGRGGMTLPAGAISRIVRWR
ncbi:hypothetical protein [Nocardia cyriacigeorgica]|uniref:hypothetical protein n=1 Tax=Nocardia cyriacigeorgica TaxID=135487 RepID=UPI0024547737|nr:hypothetical protein [Nocardia cyriacigeorgica]